MRCAMSKTRESTRLSFFSSGDPRELPGMCAINVVVVPLPRWTDEMRDATRRGSPITKWRLNGVERGPLRGALSNRVYSPLPRPLWMEVASIS